MNDHRSQKSSGTNIPPWAEIATAAFAIMFGVSIVGWSLSSSADPVPTGVARAVLDDGTVLILRQLTTGTTHEMKVEIPDESPWGRRGLGEPKIETIDMSQGGDSWSLWITRHDPDTGELLEFDRWSHCIAETSGHQVEDTNACRILLEDGQQKSYRVRPFGPPRHESNQPRVYQSWLPVLRKDQVHFQLHVFDEDQGKIATLNVPFPTGASASSDWTSGPIPQTASDGDLDVTLESLASRLHFQRSSVGPGQLGPVIPDHIPQMIIEPKSGIRQGGQPTDDWIITQYDLEDAMGNKAGLNDCRLSVTEDAWKLKLRLFRNIDAVFDTTESVEIPGLIIPAEDSVTPSRASFSNGSLKARVLAICGAGQTSLTFSSRSVGRTDSSSVGRTNSSNVRIFSPGNSNRWESEIRAGPEGAIIESQLPIVVVQTEGVTPDVRVMVLVFDQSGTPIKTSQQVQDDLLFIPFDPPGETVRIDIRLIIQRARNVEFLVKPPTIE